MTVFKKISLLCAAAVATCLIASTAFAGPVWTFGPEDQGLLKLEYKGQFQLLHRDTGAGPVAMAMRLNLISAVIVWL